jgi:hypothetical protein
LYTIDGSYVCCAGKVGRPLIHAQDQSTATSPLAACLPLLLRVVEPFRPPPTPSFQDRGLAHLLGSFGRSHSFPAVIAAVIHLVYRASRSSPEQGVRADDVVVLFLVIALVTSQAVKLAVSFSIVYDRRDSCSYSCARFSFMTSDEVCAMLQDCYS